MPSPAEQARDSVHYGLTAYGLRVACSWPLAGAGLATGNPASSTIDTRIQPGTDDEMASAWALPAERLHQPSYPDGMVRFTVDRTTDDRYRLWFDGFGRYLVTGDGRRIDCEPAGAGRARQERFIFAQALPLASLLNGFQLLHASAIHGRQGVAAFLGPSGVGKTSLASRLVLRGAGFVTDDVLALEEGPGVPLAHPGPPFMAIPAHDRAMLNSGSRLGEVVGESDKLHASPAPPSQAMPLLALFYVEPGASLGLSEFLAADTQQLLGSAFAPYMTSPDRLSGHLAVTQQISSAVRRFKLTVPVIDDFEPLLDLVGTRLTELQL